MMLMLSSISVVQAAGTSRQFTKISILAKQKLCTLSQSRYKETNNQFATVKINSFGSCDSVLVSFLGGVGASWGYLDQYEISSADQDSWVTCYFGQNESSAIIGAPIVLGAANGTYSSSSAGYISGWVNYQ